MVRESSFATALSVPNDARGDAFGEFLANSHRSKQLLIAHDMLLVGRFDFAIHLALHADVSDAIFEDIEQAFGRAHRGDDAIGRCVDAKVGLIFGCGVDDLAVEIGEDAFFGIEVDIEIGIIGMERGNRELCDVVLAEAVERRERACASAIERALDRDNATHGVVLHIVGENHQLSDVDKSAELFVRETFAIHARAFGHHAAVVVRLFDLDKHEG